MNQTFLLLPCVLLITACSSVEKKHTCSCANYQPQTPRPSWIDSERINSVALSSSGGSQCTGIQSLDFKESDQNARFNLGLLIRADVRGETNIIKRQDASTGGSSQSSIESSVSVQSLLEFAAIYDRWVDPVNCSIHSAIRLSRADYERTKKDLQANEARKPKNQLIFIQSEESTSPDMLLATLNELGAQKLTVSPSFSSPVFVAVWKNEQPQMRVEGNINAVIVQSTLLIKNRNNQIVFSVVKNGKSFRRGKVNDASFLHEQARRHALLQMHNPLKNFLNTPVEE